MVSETQKPIAILGAGSWGTALALSLARRQQTVYLWTHKPDFVKEMQKDRVNKRYIPDYPFPDSIHPTASLSEALQHCQEVLIAVPSVGFRTTLNAIKPLLQQPTGFICATKGLDLETGELLHTLAQKILGDEHQYAILSGPSFAKEVAAGLPTAVVVASHNPHFAEALVKRFNSPIFRVYTSSDITGVEIGGVVKNVLAIACGISDGMGFGANARSGLITRGLSEMTRLGIALGAQLETFMGLAGVGDLVLTCTDNQSRNRRFGLALGQGKTPEEAQQAIGQIIEGQRNAQLVVQFARQHHVEMPITEMVWEILQNKLKPAEAMKQLLSRETKKE